MSINNTVVFNILPNYIDFFLNNRLISVDVGKWYMINIQAVDQFLKVRDAFQILVGKAFSLVFDFSGSGYNDGFVGIKASDDAVCFEIKIFSKGIFLCDFRIRYKLIKNSIVERCNITNCFKRVDGLEKVEMNVARRIAPAIPALSIQSEC